MAREKSVSSGEARADTKMYTVQSLLDARFPRSVRTLREYVENVAWDWYGTEFGWSAAERATLEVEVDGSLVVAKFEREED